ncbi:MAG TPA: DUF2807 domain-containing protein, partial [Chitinophagaceae bacterium]|nr:DUF2807 domain-containing protein [Chitinophagaceae bacterium]
MGKIKTAIAAAAIVFTLPACDFINIETIHGNGNLTTETRNISSASFIESHGSFDVAIIHGASPSLKIEADENLIPYIITENEDGKLVIRTKDHVGLSSNNPVKVYVTTAEINGASL